MKKGLAVLLMIVLLCSAVSTLAEAWTCPNCGREGNDGNFCPACATAKPEPKIICPGCGAEYDSGVDYIYCPNCAAPLRQKPQKAVSVGDIVTFGTYPQTAEGNDQTPIEWIVLDYDETNHRALLLSRYGLDAKPYNTEFTVITWETCTLRSWLNSEFLNNAFSKEEQSAILLTEVDNSSGQGYSEWNTYGGNNTQDRVFLLSYAEANKYLGVTNMNNTGSRVAPTAYAMRNGAWTSDSYKTADGAVAGWWWLRSPGNNQYCAASVRLDGSLSRNSRVDYDKGVVRPAFWLNLESGIF